MKKIMLFFVSMVLVGVVYSQELQLSNSIVQADTAKLSPVNNLCYNKTLSQNTACNELILLQDNNEQLVKQYIFVAEEKIIKGKRNVLFGSIGVGVGLIFIITATALDADEEYSSQNPITISGLYLGGGLAAIIGGIQAGVGGIQWGIGKSDLKRYKENQE